MLLIARQHRRRRKRHDDNLDVAPVELFLECVDLDEVSLAGQSSEVAVKDQQQPVALELGQRNRFALGIEEAQLVDSDFFHGVTSKDAASRLAIRRRV
jgi:hypothetical protein